MTLVPTLDYSKGASLSLPRSAPPVAWVGKTPLRPLGRPQDRSGSPTKGAKRAGGNLPDCRLRAPSPTTNY
ncbi:MAG: hypothetical protein ACHBN1_16900 [Heteroscytonema crispum UTEX LB 1556]